MTANSLDQMSLVDLWRVIVGRKWIVFCGFLLGLIVGGAYILLAQPVFKASVSLRVGQIESGHGRAALENLAEVSERLVRLRLGEVVKVSMQRGEPSVLQITAEGDSPNAAIERLKTATDNIIEGHKAIFDAYAKPVLARLDALDKQIVFLRREFAEVGRLIDRLREKDGTQAALLLLQRVTITQSISELEAERLRLSQQIASPLGRPTEQLGGVISSDQPVRPRRGLVLAMAALLGIGAGVACVVMLNLSGKSRQRRNAV